MPQPSPYVPEHDYSDYSASYPQTPHNGSWLDDEFSQLALRITGIIDRVELIQRDDGQVANLSIGLDQLKPEIVLGVPTDWVTATAYAPKAVVWKSSILYVCNTAHTSGVFATDLAAVKWTAYLDYADPLGDAQDAATASAASATTSAAQAVLATAAKVAALAAQVAAEVAQAAAEAVVATIIYPIDIANGGSGATTAPTALDNFGAGASGKLLFAAADAAAVLTAAGVAGIASSWRTSLGLVIGTAVQAYDVDTTKNDVANTFIAAQSIAIAAAGAALTLTSTDAGAAVGPSLLLDRNSASPAASDVIGGVVYRGRDAANNATDYVTEQVVVTDTTNGSEDAYWSLNALVNNVVTEHIRAGGGQVLVGLGTTAVPSIAPLADTNTGFSFNGADQVHLSTAGTLKWYWESGGDLCSNNGTARIRGADGSAANPGYNFINDADNGLRRIGTDNVGVVAGGADRLDINTTRVLATVDAVLGSAAIAPTSVYSLGYRGSPIITGNSAYAFPATDAGCTVYHDEAGTRTYTIPANASVAHPIGTCFIIDNTGNAGAAGAITLAITTDTLRRGDGVAGTGSRTIAAGQRAFVHKTKSTEWVISGTFT